MRRRDVEWRPARPAPRRRRRRQRAAAHGAARPAPVGGRAAARRRSGAALTCKHCNEPGGRLGPRMGPRALGVPRPLRGRGRPRRPLQQRRGGDEHIAAARHGGPRARVHRREERHHVKRVARDPHLRHVQAARRPRRRRRRRRRHARGGGVAERRGEPVQAAAGRGQDRVPALPVYERLRRGGARVRERLCWGRARRRRPRGTRRGAFRARGPLWARAGRCWSRAPPPCRPARFLRAVAPCSAS